MWYYRLQEYISWIIISALLVAIVFYGYRLSTGQSVLRLGTGPEGSVTYQIGQQLRGSVERHSHYQVQLVPGSGSLESRQALLSNNLDMAVMTPAVLSNATSISSLAVLGYSHGHLLVPEERDPSRLDNLAGMALDAGANGSDDHWLARQFLRSAGLEDEVILMGQSPAGASSDVGIFRLTHRFDDRLQATLGEGGYVLTGIGRVGPLITSEPLYTRSELTEGLYIGAAGPVPALSQATLATPLTLMMLDSAPRDLVYRLMTVLDQPRTQQALAPYGFETAALHADNAAIVRHPAAAEYLNPRRALGMLDDLVQWLFEYRWLVLLVALLVLLSSFQLRRSQRQRRQRLQVEHQQLLHKLMNDVLKLEEAQRTERDWKTLERYRHDLTMLKKRGIDMAMSNSPVEPSLTLIFTQQCNQLAQRLEQRLALHSGSTPLSERALAKASSAPGPAPLHSEPAPVGETDVSLDKSDGSDASSPLRARR